MVWLRVEWDISLIKVLLDFNHKGADPPSAETRELIASVSLMGR